MRINKNKFGVSYSRLKSNHTEAVTSLFNPKIT